MGEKQGEAGSSNLATDGETELESIIVHTNGANAPVAVSEDENQWLGSIVHGESFRNQREVTWTKIERVPEMLRDVEENTGCYDPLVVSVGPYHHGKTRLQLMQQQKLTMARHYADENLKSLKELYEKVKPVAKSARQCYTDQSSVDKFSDEEFSKMMFLDACFILQFIYCIVKEKREDLKMKDNMIALVQRDLILLENQIPFQVLNELSSKFGDKKTMMEMLYKFFRQIHGLPPTPESCKTTIKRFLCYLAFWRKKCVLDGNDEAQTFSGEPAHLLEVIRSYLIGKPDWTNNRGEKNKGSSSQTQNRSKGRYWFSYRSAKELEAMGIHFSRSKTHKFTDVDFQSKFYCAGYLKLPQISIDDSTKSMLLNMAAYESSSNGPDDFGVSSYICFMDSLIDHAEDAKELRKKDILVNFLGSDQQVADLFNEISDNLISHPNAYKKVREGIEEHYKSTPKVWLAECWHTHFSSPWTILAFIGAILALILSFIQTYESIKPSEC